MYDDKYSIAVLIKIILIKLNNAVTEVFVSFAENITSRKSGELIVPNPIA